MNKWLNYDLHMHSYASNPADGGRVKSMSASEFVGMLEGKGVDVFSITDHDVFDSAFYLEILNHIETKSIKVLFGAELNVYINESDDSERFHMGVYFHPIKENACIIERAIRELYTNEGKPSLFKILNKFNSLNIDFIIVPEFDKTKGLTHIGQALMDNDMMDDYRRYEMQRIFNAYDRGVHFEESNILEWARAFYTRTKDYSDYCELLTEGKKNEFEKNLKLYLKNELDTSQYTDDLIKYGEIIKNYAFEFAYFHFSDWHNAEEYNPKSKNMLFGDSDYPFETLEIAICDPYSRIRIIDFNETITQDVNSLAEISFSMDGRQVVIPLTEGLNSIIGKRASGKSLLINVLLRLKNANDEGLSKYNSINIDINTIKAKKTNGTIISAGQLSSVTYLKQSEIKGLYDKPSSAESIFAEKFPKLPEIRIDNLEYIIENIDSIKPINTNYKEFNTYCFHKSETRVFTYRRINNLAKADFDSKLNSLITNFNAFQTTLQSIGFGLQHAKRLREELKNAVTSYRKIIASYADLINEANILIGEHVKELSDKESVSSQIKKNYNDSFDIIRKNFDSLLLFKQIEKRINGLDNLDVGSGERNKFDDFLFLSEYSCKGIDIRNRVQDSISGVLKPTLLRDRIDKTLKEFLIGKATFARENQSFSYSLNKEFKSTVFETKSTLFRIKSPHLYSESETINHLLDNGCLTNITNSSPGDKAAAYLEILMSSFDSILVLDQPEDDIDNNYISKTLVPLIRKKKRTKQLIFVTHNPSVAVYADAFNYVFANNSDANIEYINRTIINPKDKEIVLDILDGGRQSFFNRNMKYGDVTGEFINADKTN